MSNLYWLTDKWLQTLEMETWLALEDSVEFEIACQTTWWPRGCVGLQREGVLPIRVLRAFGVEGLSLLFRQLLLALMMEVVTWNQKEPKGYVSSNHPTFYTWAFETIFKIQRLLNLNLTFFKKGLLGLALYCKIPLACALVTTGLLWKCKLPDTVGTLHAKELWEKMWMIPTLPDPTLG